jgi:hypothetical protein
MLVRARIRPTTFDVFGARPEPGLSKSLGEHTHVMTTALSSDATAFPARVGEFRETIFWDAAQSLEVRMRWWLALVDRRDSQP